MAWASRNTAEAALAQLDHLAGLRDTVGPEGVIKALTARSGLEARRGGRRWARPSTSWRSSSSRGEPLPGGTSETATAMAEAWATWWAGSAAGAPPRRGLRRRTPTLGYGGTLDLLAYDEQGRTVLADIKTG